MNFSLFILSIHYFLMHSFFICSVSIIIIFLKAIYEETFFKFSDINFFLLYLSIHYFWAYFFFNMYFQYHHNLFKGNLWRKNHVFFSSVTLYCLLYFKLCFHVEMRLVLDTTGKSHCNYKWWKIDWSFIRIRLNATTNLLGHSTTLKICRVVFFKLVSGYN